MKSKITILFSLVTFLIVLLSYSPAILAVSLKNTGLTVSPAITQIQLANQQNSYALDYHLINNTKSPVIIDFTAQNFTSLNNNGSVYILPSINQNNPHGLAKDIYFSLPRLSLEPGTSTNLAVSLKHLRSLPPGGYYGAIVFNVLGQKSSGPGNNISLLEKLNALIFLTTPGRVDNSLVLQPFHQGTSLHLPNNISLVFTNTGNTQVAPHGVVTISHGTSEIYRGIINTNSSLVLPGTSRLFNVVLRKETLGINFPGIYTLHVTYTPGNTGNSSSSSRSFLLINSLAIYMVIGLVIIIAIVMWLLKLSRYRKYQQQKQKHINSTYTKP